MALTREQHRETMRPKMKDVMLKGVEEPQYLRGLTAGQRDRFSASCRNPDGTQNLIDANARLVAMAWVDADGKPLGYTEQDVAEMDGGLVGQLADAVVEQNGLGKKAVDDIKAQLLARPESRLLYRIAEKVGKTVEWIKDTMSSEEVSGWLALFMLEADELEAARQRPPHG